MFAPSTATASEDSSQPQDASSNAERSWSKFVKAEPPRFLQQQLFHEPQDPTAQDCADLSTPPAARESAPTPPSADAQEIAEECQRSSASPSARVFHTIARRFAGLTTVERESAASHAEDSCAEDARRNVLPSMFTSAQADVLQHHNALADALAS